MDDAVRAAVDVLRGAGLAAEEVSIPWHVDAMAVWNVIATEGAAFQMIDGNAYGMNSQGLYDPELIAHYAAQRHRPTAPSCRRRSSWSGCPGATRSRSAGGKYYAMARNLAFELRQAYDDALSAYDVLVMPTLPFTAQELLPLDAPLEELPADGAVDDRQLRPVRRHRAPGVHASPPGWWTGCRPG